LLGWLARAALGILAIISVPIISQRVCNIDSHKGAQQQVNNYFNRAPIGAYGLNQGEQNDSQCIHTVHRQRLYTQLGRNLNESTQGVSITPSREGVILNKLFAYREKITKD